MGEGKRRGQGPGGIVQGSGLRVQGSGERVGKTWGLAWQGRGGTCIPVPPRALCATPPLSCSCCLAPVVLAWLSAFPVSLATGMSSTCGLLSAPSCHLSSPPLDASPKSLTLAVYALHIQPRLVVSLPFFSPFLPLLQPPLERQTATLSASCTSPVASRQVQFTYSLAPGSGVPTNHARSALPQYQQHTVCNFSSDLLTPGKVRGTVRGGHIPYRSMPAFA